MSLDDLHILLIDDNPDDRLLARRELEKEFPSATFTEVGDPQAYADALAGGPFDLVITDYHLVWADGLEVLDAFREKNPVRPIIMFTGTGSEQVAVDAMKSGLDDYVLKTSHGFVRLRGSARAAVETARRTATLEEERRRAEARLEETLQELRRSEERYRRIVDNAKDVIYRYRYWPDPGYEYVSPSVTRVFGYTPEEYYADPELGLSTVHPGDVSVIERMRRDPEASGHHSWTVRWRHRDGHIVWTEELSTPVYDDQGRLVAMEGVARDMTEARKAQEANRRLIMALDQSAEGVVILNERQFVSWANRAFLDMSGYTMDELVGASPADLGGELFAAARPEILENVARGESWRGNSDLARKDGTVLGLVSTITPVLDEAGELVGVVGIMHDVTRERELEEQLRHSQRLEAVGRLAGGVAHDFNNVLTAIIGYSDILLQRLDGDESSREDVFEIKRSAERASSLTRQLLAFSRRQVLRMERVDVNAAVEGMVGILERVIGEDIVLVTVLDPLAGSVQADAGQLEQVIMNLAVNARDAMPQGGTLTVETARLDAADVPDGVEIEQALSDEVSARDGEDAWLVIRVRDTGIGMEPDVQEHLFEPFFTTKEEGEGTGLGLPMVYGIVKQSGGDIIVETEPGVGSVFSIFLPWAGPAETEPEAAPEAAVDRTTAGDTENAETVLLAEDDDVVRRLAKRVLLEQGYRVVEAVDGQDGFALGRSLDDLDLLVTDLTMPGMDGARLARSLAELHPDLRVVIMSGYADDRLEEADIAADEVVFLEKPFKPKRFVNVIRELLDS